MLDHTSDDSDFPTDATIFTRSYYEDAITAQEEAERHFAELVIEDTNRCTGCGLITSGSQIAGQLCLICDSCLVDWAIAQLGTSIFREKLTA